MKASTFLKIAAVLTLLYCIGHTSGAPWTPGESAADMAVVDAMKSDHFPVIGFSRSYWDFYFGFGVIVSVMLLTQAVVLWQLGSLAKNDPARIRGIIAVFFLAFAANAVLSWIYFFPIPVVNASLIAICLALAYVKAGKSTG